jgi:hypothetical protein
MFVQYQPPDPASVPKVCRNAAPFRGHPAAISAHFATDTRQCPDGGCRHVLVQLAHPPRPAPSLRLLQRTGRVAVRWLRSPPAAAARAAVRALRGAHGTAGPGVPRLQPAALVHDGALRVVAGGARARPGRPLEARRDLTGAPGSRADGARAPAATRGGDRRRSRRARPPAAARRRSAGGARGRAGALVGRAGRAAGASHARRASPARARCRCAPAQRARRLRGPCRPALPRARRRRLHHGRDRRRVRPGAVPGGRGAGARGDAGAHAPRSDLCARAPRWQTPGTEVSKRGGTRCNFR